ncbi:MAG: GntR family transcriptional regulator [Betaproteobacteria bacterium]|nr:GntR family transcriptional regulator [Betaproteobacteria bacterium]
MRALTPQPTLVDQVYDAILSEITEGKYGPDSRLIQEQMAESLGVSRQPVQQALLLLRSHGLLVDAPGRGLMVAPLEADRVRNLYEVRAVLDGLASAKAAERNRETAAEEGAAYITRGRAAVKSGSIARMIAADMDFHFFLYGLSGNPLVAEMSGAHWSYLRRVMGEVLLRGETPKDIWDQHEAILECVSRGDAALAERIARDHISEASDVLASRLAELATRAPDPVPAPRRRRAVAAR